MNNKYIGNNYAMKMRRQHEYILEIRSKDDLKRVLKEFTEFVKENEKAERIKANEGVNYWSMKEISPHLYALHTDVDLLMNELLGEFEDFVEECEKLREEIKGKECCEAGIIIDEIGSEEELFSELCMEDDEADGVVSSASEEEEVMTSSSESDGVMPVLSHSREMEAPTMVKPMEEPGSSISGREMSTPTTVDGAQHIHSNGEMGATITVDEEMGAFVNMEEEEPSSGSEDSSKPSGETPSIDVKEGDEGRGVVPKDLQGIAGLFPSPLGSGSLVATTGTRAQELELPPSPVEERAGLCSSPDPLSVSTLKKALFRHSAFGKVERERVIDIVLSPSFHLSWLRDSLKWRLLNAIVAKERKRLAMERVLMKRSGDKRGMPLNLEFSDKLKRFAEKHEFLPVNKAVKFRFN